MGAGRGQSFALAVGEQAEAGTDLDSRMAGSDCGDGIFDADDVTVTGPATAGDQADPLGAGPPMTDAGLRRFTTAGRIQGGRFSRERTRCRAGGCVPVWCPMATDGGSGQ